MKQTIIILAATLATTCVFAQKTPYVSEVWCADLGNGNYKNPVLYADYSDPDVCRVGDDYYMTASSFACVPGLPILHSKDLVNWELINYAIERMVPAEQFDVVSHGNGVWAPSIRHHNGEFYIYWGDPDNGIYMVRTKDPYARWEKPVLVHKAVGIIDTCPYWDEDGRAWIGHGYAGSRAGVKSILGLIEMTPDGTQSIGEDRVIYDGHEENVTIEGVKFYKRNGYYYIMSPAGGVPTGYQLAMRSKTIDGPYEWKIVMAQGKSPINGPHQGALVDTPDGSEHWFIHFQDVGAVGRLAHLNPVHWVQDWPVVGIDNDGDLCGEPVTTHKKPNLPTQPICNPVESDDFNSNKLGLQWSWQANNNALWYFADAAHSRLRLFSAQVVENYQNLWDVQNLCLQKLPAPEFTATAKVKFAPSEKYLGERSGLVLMGLDYATLVMENTADGIKLTQNTCLKADKGATEIAKSDAVKVKKNEDIWLRVVVRAEMPKFKTPKEPIIVGPGADVVNIAQFYYSRDGKKFSKLGEEFTLKEGKWIGTKIGMFCTRDVKSNDSGWLDVDKFEITKNSSK